MTTGRTIWLGLLTLIAIVNIVIGAGAAWNREYAKGSYFTIVAVLLVLAASQDT
jgi:hypothetical protein